MGFVNRNCIIFDSDLMYYEVRNNNYGLRITEIKKPLVLFNTDGFWKNSTESLFFVI